MGRPGITVSVSPPEKPPSSYLPAYSSGASSISPAHLRFFAALGGDRPNALFFAGDLGAADLPAALLLEVPRRGHPGRSRTLRVNYRTSHQIRTQADRLLVPVVTDVDGNSEDRSDTVSVFFPFNL